MSEDQRVEDRIRKHTRKCLNFNGIMNDECRAGVNYDEQAGTNYGALKRLPCLLDHRSPDEEDHVACPQARYPTREEALANIEESERRIRETMRNIALGICPRCHKDGKWSQVGRCVYCDECGHRIYQGTLPVMKRGA